MSDFYIVVSGHTFRPTPTSALHPTALKKNCSSDPSKTSNLHCDPNQKYFIRSSWDYVMHGDESVQSKSMHFGGLRDRILARGLMNSGIEGPGKRISRSWGLMQRTVRLCQPHRGTRPATWGRLQRRTAILSPAK